MKVIVSVFWRVPHRASCRAMNLHLASRAGHAPSTEQSQVNAVSTGPQAECGPGSSRPQGLLSCRVVRFQVSTSECIAARICVCRVIHALRPRPPHCAELAWPILRLEFLREDEARNPSTARGEKWLTGAGGANSRAGAIDATVGRFRDLIWLEGFSESPTVGSLLASLPTHGLSCPKSPLASIQLP